MAQPIYFNPAPARYKYLEGVAEGQVGKDIADGVANMFMAYATHKEQERQDALKMQLALAKEFGFKSFGEPFAKSMESTVGRQLFPRDAQGNIVLPKTEQEQQDEELAKRYPDPEQRQHMWAVAHKLEKPDPGPAEIKLREDIENRRDQRMREREASQNIRAKYTADRAAARDQLRYDRDWHNRMSPFTLYKGTLVPYDERTLRKDPGATPLTNGDADFIMKYNKYSLDRKGKQISNKHMLLQNEVLTQKMLDAKDDVMLEVTKQAKPFIDIVKTLNSKALKDNPEKANQLVVGTLRTLLQHKVDHNTGERKYSDEEINAMLQDHGFVETMKEHTTSFFSHFDLSTHTSGGLLGAGATTTTTEPPRVQGGVPLDPQAEADSYHMPTGE